MPSSANLSTQWQYNPEWDSMEVEEIGDSFYNNNEDPLSRSVGNLKASKLREALDKGRTQELRKQLKSPQGLINNELRSKIWPLLLGVDKEAARSYNGEAEEGYLGLMLRSPETAQVFDEINLNGLPIHRDEEQVMVDIKRSYNILKHEQLPSQLHGESFTAIFSDSDIRVLKKQLHKLIVSVLRKYPLLNYYQGYHDIASIVLLICRQQTSGSDFTDDELAFKVLENITLFHLRDFMISDMSLTVNHLRLVPYLLEKVDFEFFLILKSASNSYLCSQGLYYEYDFYPGLSAILTFYSHDWSNLEQLLTFWDFLLGYNSVLINVYFYVALLLFRKRTIYEKLGLASDSTKEVDPDMLHAMMTPNSLLKSLGESDLARVLNDTSRLIDTCPIDKLENSCDTFDLWFKKFNTSSVIMTTSTLRENSLTECTLYKNLFELNNGDAGETLESIIKKQEEEILEQSLYMAATRTKLEDELSNSLSDLDTKTPTLLSSSLASLDSVTSTVSTKIINSSSALKNIFQSGPDDVSKEDKGTLGTFKMRPYITIGVAIGCIGIFIHVILLKTFPKYSHYELTRTLQKLLDSGIFKSALEYLASLKEETISAFKSLLESRDQSSNNALIRAASLPLSSGVLHFEDVGIGTIKKTIYNL